mmetsp:Transcript_25720/g.36320  ORF Transcript_25720/g.36320 Transcript_25720/m.36320 type:complete len:171 (-) Transcript_25720:30-542(-)
MSEDFMFLEAPHTPAYESEKARIQAAGGKTRMQGGIERVCVPNTNTPVLAVSRSFGDLTFKAGAKVSGRGFVSKKLTLDQVSVLPYVAEHDLSSIEFIVVASDGLWDYVKPESVVSYVRDCLSQQRQQSGRKVDCQAICDQLVAWAVREQAGEQEGHGDNVSAVLICCST